MSIPIAARRYIAELGLSDRKWSVGEIQKSGYTKDHKLVVCQRKKNEFYIFHVFFNGYSWITWNPEAGYCEVENIVCWSEIKT